MCEKDLPAAMALSYLGDAVYSLYVRQRLVALGISHAGELNRLSLAYVTAPRQAALAKRLLPLLTEEETGVYRRAFNHKGLSRPAHASYGEYRAATGFEAVLGALYHLGERERLYALLDEIHQNEFNEKDDKTQ
jgi:ribonuclease-3 family protein